MNTIQVTIAWPQIAGAIGYVRLKVSCVATVTCFAVLAYRSRARECLSYAVGTTLLLGLGSAILTILGWSVHSWTMILIFPALSFAVSVFVMLMAAAVHAVAERKSVRKMD
jgi:hypothetical protein